MLELSQPDFEKAFNLCRGVVKRRNTLPILGAVKIEKGKLSVTNLDIVVEASFASKGKLSRTLAIEFGPLARVIGSVPEGDAINLDAQKEGHDLAFNGASYQFLEYPVVDFPHDLIKIESDAPTENVSNMGLIDVLSRVRFCISSEKTRYYLNGVSFMMYKGKAFAVATDGHRMALYPLDHIPCDGVGAIFPSRLVAYLVARKQEPQTLSILKTKACRFTWPGLEIRAKMIDGPFPDISRVIPEAKPVAEIDRLKLLTIVRRTSSINKKWSGGKFIFSANSVQLTGGLKGDGTTFRESLDCTVYVPDFEINFNLKYVLEMLSNMRGDMITVSCDGAMGASLWTSKTDRLQVLLMPMRG